MSEQEKNGTVALQTEQPPTQPQQMHLQIQIAPQGVQLTFPVSPPGPPFSSFSAYEPGFRTPRAWQGNFTLEHSLATHTATRR